MFALFLLAMCALSVQSESQIVTTILKTPEVCDVLAKEGDEIHFVHSGYRTDSTATQFDSTIDGKPVVVTVGEGQVIQGLDESFVGKCEGMVYSVIIPADKAYGDPSKQFRSTMGLEDAAVRYEVEVVKLLPYYDTTFWLDYGLIFGLLGAGAYVAYLQYNHSSKQKRSNGRTKNKKRKR